MSEPHVRLVNITKRFGNTVAVDNVTLDVARGSFTTLLGPSGCGKTTALRMIAGFHDPDTGDIFIGERRVNEVPSHQRNTAMVFQEYALFPHMSVFENVAYGLTIRGLPRPQVAQKVRATLKFLALEGLDDRSPHQLSGGQQQRVALARALVMEPEVLLLDEPLSNLDAKLRVSVRTEMTQIQRSLKLTTIYVTHDQEEALAMSDAIAVMHQGRVVRFGTPWEVYYRPRDRFVADFVGLVNFVEGRLVEVGPQVLVADVAGRPLRFAPEGLALRPGDDVLLSIRPECIGISPAAPSGAANVLHGQVAASQFLGRLVRYWVAVDGTTWVVDEPDPSTYSLLSGEVYLTIEPGKVHVIAEENKGEGGR
ncbi:MAG: ABC transporter ATP-binding protein [Chloroflexota bacterium]